MDFKKFCTDPDRITLPEYAAAARVIGLHLREFCDDSLTYPEMISVASRRAAEELGRLRALHQENLKAAVRGITYINHYPTNPVAKHALGSILKHSRMALGQEVPYVTPCDSNNDN